MQHNKSERSKFASTTFSNSGWSASNWDRAGTLVHAKTIKQRSHLLLLHEWNDGNPVRLEARLRQRAKMRRAPCCFTEYREFFLWLPLQPQWALHFWITCSDSCVNVATRLGCDSFSVKGSVQCTQQENKLLCTYIRFFHSRVLATVSSFLPPGRRWYCGRKLTPNAD